MSGEQGQLAGMETPSKPKVHGRENNGRQSWKDSPPITDPDMIAYLDEVDTYQNMRRIALSWVLDESKFIQSRISALKFLYPDGTAKTEDENEKRERTSPILLVPDSEVLTDASSETGQSAST